MSKNCRFCNALLQHSFCNLGKTPLSNSYLSSEDLHKTENAYPLHAFVCEKCFLVQVEEFEKPEAIFSQYSYFSSFSDSWLHHSKNYAEAMLGRFKLKSVVEIGSNDGYLLQFFKLHKIAILGIEPAKNVAAVAESKGIPTICDFFGKTLATQLKEKGTQADLIVANNVLAQVPDLNDFVSGIKVLLAPQGVVTVEFPHLLNLIEENQIDTIYHEHFSYFSFFTVNQVFAKHGLSLFDIELIPTHGGSLRIFGKHAEDASRPVTKRILEITQLEKERGLLNLATYLDFDPKARLLKDRFLHLLEKLRKEGKKIAAYGAPAKGNTLLNYCGATKDLIQFTVDKSPHKQGKYLPGSRIPIYAPEKILEEKPDFLIILPWNIKEEIMNQMSFIQNWGGRFIVPIPEPRIIG